MKKHLLSSIILSLFMIISTIAVPVYAADDDHSLTMEFLTESGAIRGSQFDFYLALDIDGELTADFSDYDIMVGDLTDGDSVGILADTLAAYAIRDGITPVASDTTNAYGRAEAAGLKSGIYLAVGTSVTVGNYIYTPKPCLVKVPYIDNDNKLVTDAVAEVKYDFREIVHDKTERSVIKIWSEDNEYNRPSEVTVELLKDGEKYDEVTLNEASGWEYTWTELDADSDWLITEESVPAGYKVSIHLNDTTFVVENTFDGDLGGDGDKNSSDSDLSSSEPDSSENDDSSSSTSDAAVDHGNDSKLPQTGQLWWPVPMLLIAGIVVFLVGIVIVNINHNEE